MQLTPEEQDLIKRIQTRSVGQQNQVPKMPEGHGLDLTFGNSTLKDIGDTIHNVLPTGNLPFYGQTKEPESDYTKLANAMALAKYRQDLKPASEGYFTLDENGQPVPIEGVNGMKPVPVGYSGQGQRALSNRADASASMVPLRAAQTVAAETGNKVMEQYLGGDPSDHSKNGLTLPPGTSINAGPMNIPLNPALNEQQMSSVAGEQSLDPIVSSIESDLKSGILDSSMGNVGRTIRQGIADSKNYLVSSMDHKLQSFQSKLNTLKKTLPFTEGGKQLTPFEANQVFALLNITGKNNDQISTDINQALQIVRAKSRLTIGGRNEALNPYNAMKGSNQPSFVKQNTPTPSGNEQLPPELQALVAKGMKVTKNG